MVRRRQCILTCRRLRARSAIECTATRIGADTYPIRSFLNIRPSFQRMPTREDLGCATGGATAIALAQISFQCAIQLVKLRYSQCHVMSIARFLKDLDGPRNWSGSRQSPSLRHMFPTASSPGHHPRWRARCSGTPGARQSSQPATAITTDS